MSCSARRCSFSHSRGSVLFIEGTGKVRCVRGLFCSWSDTGVYYEGAHPPTFTRWPASSGHILGTHKQSRRWTTNSDVDQRTRANTPIKGLTKASLWWCFVQWGPTGPAARLSSGQPVAPHRSSDGRSPAAAQAGTNPHTLSPLGHTDLVVVSIA